MPLHIKYSFRGRELAAVLHPTHFMCNHEAEMTQRQNFYSTDEQVFSSLPRERTFIPQMNKFFFFTSADHAGHRKLTLLHEGITLTAPGTKTTIKNMTKLILLHEGFMLTAPATNITIKNMKH